jgi:hypothetical protein
MFVGAEVHMAEGESPLDAKRLRMSGQICAKVVVRRQGLGDDVIAEELHFLSQTAADDRVILVQSERHGLPAVDLFPHPIPDQSVQFFAGGRPLPGADEGLAMDATCPCVTTILPGSPVRFLDRRP